MSLDFCGTKTILKPNSKTKIKIRDIGRNLYHFLSSFMLMVPKNFYKGVTILEIPNNTNLEIEGNIEAV